MTKLKIYAKNVRNVCALILMLLLMGSNAWAAKTNDQATKTTSDPSPSSVPVLANLVKMGMKTFYLGEESGIQGWLLVKDSQIQFAYVPPGGKDIIIGAMYDSAGQSITAAQLARITQENPSILGIINNSAKLPPVVQNNTTNAANSSPTEGGASLGEKILQDFSGAAGVSVGNASAPLLTMVMDPNCPHCQASWRALRDSVFKNTIQVRLIPIATPDTDGERAAAVLLHHADPLNAWDKYVGGDKTSLVGTPDPAVVASIHANHVLVDSWHIDSTPFFMYRDKTGHVKIIKGELQKVEIVLADLVP